ncbi:MAG: recombinase family protein [Clostridia bacterium]
MTDVRSYENPAQVAPISTENAVRRVAAYCRVSTLAEEQELSYETQCAYYARLIDADRTMTLVEVYGDQGGSGLSLKKRPEFQRMMSDCLGGKIDLILTKSVSRFARNLSDCVNCIRLLREKGIPVLFEKEGINSTEPSSEMLLSVLASMAQQEVHSLSESIRWSLEHRNASGNPARGARYGYRKVEDESGKKIWRIYEPETERVRLAFHMAVQGEKYREICNALNKMEIRDGTGVEWSQPRVNELLQSEVYLGDILTNKTYTADYLTKKVVKNKGQKPQYYLEGHHEAIIDRATFEQVGEWIHQNKLRTKKGAYRK